MLSAPCSKGVDFKQNHCKIIYLSGSYLCNPRGGAVYTLCPMPYALSASIRSEGNHVPHYKGSEVAEVLSLSRPAISQLVDRGKILIDKADTLDIVRQIN